MWCKFWQLELSKVLRRRQFLTILTSKSFLRAGVVQILATSTSKSAPRLSVFNDLTFKSCSRAGVVQILATWTSKSAPTPSVFNDFGFQIVLARRRDANFATSWAADPPHPPVLRSWLSQPAKPQNYGKTKHFAHFLPAINLHVSHLCCITSARSHLLDRSSAATFSIVGS